MEGKSCVFSESRDDLYNLSVRKKALQLCERLLENLESVRSCYAQIEDEDENIKRFIRENEQVIGIISSIARAVGSKKKIPLPEFTLPIRENTRYLLCALLVEIASDLVSLTAIISIPRMERELVLAGDLLLKQLTYILPYKLHQ